MTLVSEWALLPRTRGKSDCPSPSGSLGHRKLARLAPQVHFAHAGPFFSMVTLGSTESLAERLGGLYGDTCPFPSGQVHFPIVMSKKKREDLTGRPLLPFFGIVPITADDGASPLTTSPHNR